MTRFTQSLTVAPVVRITAVTNGHNMIDNRSASVSTDSTDRLFAQHAITKLFPFGLLIGHIGNSATRSTQPNTVMQLAALSTTISGFRRHYGDTEYTANVVDALVAFSVTVVP